MTKMNVEHFEKKFGLWYSRFKPFLETKEAAIIYDSLRERSNGGAKIFPKSEYTFRAFEITNPNNINCIIIGQSPYHTINRIGIPHADGLAFSAKFAKELTPSLNKWYDGMDKDLDKKVYRTENLDYLAEQGVLLLNASFTTELGKSSIHEDLQIWDSFNNFLYKEILKGFCGIPVVCMGNSAKYISKLLFPLCHIIKVIEHPAYAARLGKQWENEDCFNWINKILKERNGPFTQIEWDHVAYQDLPF